MSSNKKDIEQALLQNQFQVQELQEQFCDIEQKFEKNDQSKSKSTTRQQKSDQITQEQLDKLLTQIDQNQEDDNISAQEMLDNLKKTNNLLSLDSTSMQTRFEEIRYLLSLFGIPWIMAPGEAEAQCAYLQEKGLVDCVITEDSDVFLFGATKVLRGLFQKETNITYYDSKFIKEDLGLTRDQLIYLALFLGSDYTIGIKGVGIVNAMEIVEVFDNLEALKRFQIWASKADVLLQNVEQHYENIPEKEKHYKEQHKNYKKQWELPNNFPDYNVIEGYKSPKIDKSLEKFTWAKPAVDKIIEFCQNQLMFSEQRIDEYIKQPLNKILQKNDQKQITDYFQVNGKIAIINSRRINQVIANLNDSKKTGIQIQPKKRKQTQKKNEIKKTNITSDEIGDIINCDNYIFKKKQKQ